MARWPSASARNTSFWAKRFRRHHDFSEGSAALIDQEVQQLLREADDRAFELLSLHRDKMERLVAALLQREELLREEIDQILRAESNGVVAPSVDGEMAKS